MSTRTIYLVSYRNSPSQRAHFAIFVPSAANPNIGTLIHAVGAPMAGYRLEFKRNYNPITTIQRREIYPIGQVNVSNIVDYTLEGHATDYNPKGNLEIAASQVPTPGISQNFMAPVNDVTNKRCQEWTMEYVRYLVSKGYVNTEAIDIVQSKRDPPSHGVGLQPVARR